MCHIYEKNGVGELKYKVISLTIIKLCINLLDNNCNIPMLMCYKYFECKYKNKDNFDLDHKV